MNVYVSISHSRVNIQNVIVIVHKIMDFRIYESGVPSFLFWINSCIQTNSIYFTEVVMTY